MRKFIAAAAIGATLIIQFPTQASAHCFGCNIVDDGQLNQSLIGRTVYFHTLGHRVPVTVDGIDWNSRLIHWRTSDGQHGWDYPNQYYTEETANQQDGAALVAGALGALFVCAAACPRNHASYGSQAADDWNVRQRQQQQDNWNYDRARQAQDSVNRQAYGGQ